MFIPYTFDRKSCYRCGRYFVGQDNVCKFCKIYPPMLRQHWQKEAIDCPIEGCPNNINWWWQKDNCRYCGKLFCNSCLKFRIYGLIACPTCKEKHHEKEHKVKPRSPIKWQPDAAVVKCATCDQLFNFIHRKHHCRFCGHIGCHECTKNKLAGERLCDHCKIHNPRLQVNISGSEWQVKTSCDVCQQDFNSDRPKQFCQAAGHAVCLHCTKQRDGKQYCNNCFQRLQQTEM